MNELFPSRAAGMFGRRLKRERGHRIPVTVVTGFLGAGKTTLLRRFLGTPEGQGTAVVVNEFGATGIDDALVRSSTDETVLLGNGCLCCITRSDLQQALRRMVIERERGEMPAFKRIVIETSGLADPSPILQTFATDRALGEVFHIEAVVTVVDAETGGDTLDLVGGGAPAGDTRRPAGDHQDRHCRRRRRRSARRAIARAQSGRRNPRSGERRDRSQPADRAGRRRAQRLRRRGGAFGRYRQFRDHGKHTDAVAGLRQGHGHADGAARAGPAARQRASSMSTAARGRWWCNSCSTSRIRRSSSTRGRTATSKAGLCSSRRIFGEQQVRDLFAAVRALV